MFELAKRIDQNVVNFDRARRELPSAELSITLPIAMIGVDADAETSVVDMTATGFTTIADIVGRGNEVNRWRLVHGYLAGQSWTDGPGDQPPDQEA